MGGLWHPQTVNVLATIYFRSSVESNKTNSKDLYTIKTLPCIPKQPPIYHHHATPLHHHSKGVRHDPTTQHTTAPTPNHIWCHCVCVGHKTTNSGNYTLPSGTEKFVAYYHKKQTEQGKSQQCTLIRNYVG